MNLDWILLEDCTNPSGIARLFANPKTMIIANSCDELPNAFAQMKLAQKDGFFLAGFTSYEFGLCNEELTRDFARTDFPLLAFGVYEAPRILRSAVVGRYLRKINQGAGVYVRDINYSRSREDYEIGFNNIKQNIKQGHIYQANLTFKLDGKMDGSSLALYEKLRVRQLAKYCAFLKSNDGEILSLSPELFFLKHGDKIETHPMKGTIGRNIENAFEVLQNDEKQRAENLMITDLMRNDLAKISSAGSVKVSSLFAIEEYPTLLQMISKISAQAKPNFSTKEILRNIAPAGSITGCPKIRAEELIFANENTPRGIYCGNIGFIEPNDDAVFNVAIRTLAVKNSSILMGVGSGIVYDSKCDVEYDECLLKSKFLVEVNEPFSLIETLKWTRNSGFMRIEKHLSRLKNAAQHFGFEVDWMHLDEMLANCAKNIAWDNARIRIFIEKESQEVGIFEFDDKIGNWEIVISPTIMQSNNPWSFYKTTNRKIYDDEWAKFHAQGFDEVIYCNENGELTEGSRTNIFVDFGDGILATPPQKCGLLNGILRQELLESRQAIEKILRPFDLQRAKKIYVGNSLRGLKEAKIGKF